MITLTRRILYPEGDIREIPHTLRINQLVDLNGNPLSLPLKTSKMIAYRVFKISMQSTRNESITNYHLELMNRMDLEQYTKKEIFL
jgi:hypothetical protein